MFRFNICKQRILFSNFVATVNQFRFLPVAATASFNFNSTTSWNGGISQTASRYSQSLVTTSRTSTSSRFSNFLYPLAAVLVASSTQFALNSLIDGLGFADERTAAQAERIVEKEAEEEEDSQIELVKILECLESIEQKSDLRRIYIPSRNLRLLGQLDEGACGQIWAGELHDGPNIEKVAVKVLSDDSFDNETFARLIRTEAEVFQRVSVRCHHVCRFYGLSVKHRKLCLIMKHYRRSLTQMMREQSSHGLSLADVKKYGTQICKGLAELHEQGIILQDLKPSNVLVDDLDNAVLADFGLSSFIDKKGGKVITPSKGTPSYMAPESWDPKSMGGMSVKTDVWSFGCVILELLTGTSPWQGMEPTEIAQIVKDQKRRPPIPSGLPRTLSSTLEKCFAYHSESRPDAKELLHVFLSEWEEADQNYFSLPPILPVEVTPKLIIPAEQSSLYSFDLYPEYVFAIPEVKPLYEIDPGLYKGVVRMQHLMDGI
eukprot:g4525.t1